MSDLLKTLRKRVLNAVTRWRNLTGLPALQVRLILPVTSFVPKAWEDWFWGELSELGSLTWGGATEDATLVTAENFAEAAKEVLSAAVEDGDITQEEMDNFLETVRSVDGRFGGATCVYIDMEQ
jgi:hypothetical protein